MFNREGEMPLGQCFFSTFFEMERKDKKCIWIVQINHQNTRRELLLFGDFNDVSQYSRKRI